MISHWEEGDKITTTRINYYYLTVSSLQKKWPLRKECGSHRGDQVLALSNLRSPDTGRGKREKPNDWLGPQNGSGAPFPSAEVKDKKNSFWAGFVVGGRTIAILLRVEDKRITETRRTLGSSSQCKKNRTKSISLWKKKRFSSGTPSKKNIR